MHRIAPIAAAVLALTLTGLATGSAVAGRAQSPPTAAASNLETREALARARAEAGRARERAAVLDRRAQASAIAGERATLAAAALAARVQQSEAALAGAEAELTLVREQRRALAARLARERAPVARLMAGMQTLVRRPVLLTLAQPGSVEDAVHLRAVVAAVQPQIRARTASLRQALTRVGALEAEANKIAGQRLALRTDLLARRSELTALSAAERVKARRAAGAADREAERAFAIGEQARDLASLVRQLAVRSGGGSPARRTIAGMAQVQGAPVPYRLPVAGAPAPAALAPGGTLTLLAQPGALAVAPAAGRVAFAGPYRGFGAIVIIEHADGWTSLITGLARVQVAVGQAVIAGSPLGQAPARAPRIGLELRRNGERVNPLDQLR